MIGELGNVSSLIRQPSKYVDRTVLVDLLLFIEFSSCSRLFVFFDMRPDSVGKFDWRYGNVL